MFRDPRQLESPAFIATLERIPAAIGHPITPEGKYLYPCVTAVDPMGEPAPFAADAVLVPFNTIQVGSVGDKIEMVDGGEGFLVPQGRVTVTDPGAVIGTIGADGQPRKDETSLAFVKHDIPEPGVWVNPRGESVPYDIVQIVDPSDERVPAELKPWLGAHYLGIMFDRGKSRGGMTRIALDGATPTAVRRTIAPRTFFMYRQQDESGVSGTGHVLDGVIWPCGRTSFCWNSDTASVGAFDTYNDFASTHIDSHPTNDTIVTFDDGGQPPTAPTIPADSQQPEPEEDPMNAEQLLAKIAEMEKKYGEEIAALKAQVQALTGEKSVADNKAALALAEAEKQKQAATDATAAASASAARVDSLEAELKPIRERASKRLLGEIAKVAGIDSQTIAATAGIDGKPPTTQALKAAAMRQHFELGLSPAPKDATRLKDEVYLAARYDTLADTIGVDSDEDEDEDEAPLDRALRERLSGSDRRNASPEFRRAHSRAPARSGTDSRDEQPAPDAINDLA